MAQRRRVEGIAPTSRPRLLWKSGSVKGAPVGQRNRRRVRGSLDRPVRVEEAVDRGGHPRSSQEVGPARMGSTRPSMPRLCQGIGRLKVKLDWLKKKLESVEDRRLFGSIGATPKGPLLHRPLRVKCTLLDVARSSAYLRPVVVSEKDCKLMTLQLQVGDVAGCADTRTLFYGSR